MWRLGWRSLQPMLRSTGSAQSVSHPPGPSPRLWGAIGWNAATKSSSIIATIIGFVTVLVTASGVFVEMQSSLNAIWKAELQGTTLSRWIRARAASIGLVAALGFLLMVSLLVSAGLTAFGNYFNSILPFGELILTALNTVISVGLLSVLFAAIHKVLPDRHLEWGDVMVGAVVTAILFTIGKSLIGWYIGSSAVASTYGAAGALMVLLLWVYYTAQIFLLGAEFTTKAPTAVPRSWNYGPSAPCSCRDHRSAKQGRGTVTPVGFEGHRDHSPSEGSQDRGIVPNGAAWAVVGGLRGHTRRMRRFGFEWRALRRFGAVG